MQDPPALASGDTSKPASATAKGSAQQQQQQQHEGNEHSTSMSRLAAKVDSDRTKSAASREAYTGYLKACGLLVVSAALAMSVLAQVRALNFQGRFFCPLGGAFWFSGLISLVTVTDEQAGEAGTAVV